MGLKKSNEACVSLVKYSRIWNEESVAFIAGVKPVKISANLHESQRP